MATSVRFSSGSRSHFPKSPLKIKSSQSRCRAIQAVTKVNLRQALHRINSATTLTRRLMRPAQALRALQRSSSTRSGYLTMITDSRARRCEARRPEMRSRSPSDSRPASRNRSKVRSQTRTPPCSARQTSSTPSSSSYRRQTLSLTTSSTSTTIESSTSRASSPGLRSGDTSWVRSISRSLE